MISGCTAAVREDAPGSARSAGLMWQQADITRATADLGWQPRGRPGDLAERLVGGNSVTAPVTGGTRLATPRLLVPAYFHPAVRPDDWAVLAARAAQVRLVILNLANGPGTRPDEACLPALDRLRAAGVGVIGYVDTDYGRRPPRRDGRVRLATWTGTGWPAFSSIGWPPPPSTSAISPRWRVASAPWARGWWCSTTARTRLRRTPSTPTCSARSRAPGVPTVTLPCQAGHARGRRTTSTTSCTRYHASTLGTPTSSPHGAGQAARTSRTAAGVIRMISCRLTGLTQVG